MAKVLQNDWVDSERFGDSELISSMGTQRVMHHHLFIHLIRARDRLNEADGTQGMAETGELLLRHPKFVADGLYIYVFWNGREGVQVGNRFLATLVGRILL